MGAADATMNPYLGDPQRFAEVFNQAVFSGQQVIDPAKLKNLDASNRIFGKEPSVRDIVKSYGDEMILAILAIENQQGVHYAMPLRNYLYDGNTYEKQRKSIAKKHREEKDLEGDEYVSGFAKTDKLIPVITLVVYSGRDWDGPKQLHDMLDIPEELKPFKPLIANYSLNLLEIGKLDNLDSYSDELQLVFGFIKYRWNKAALLQFIQTHEDLLKQVPQEAGEVIQAVTGSKKILKCMEQDKEVSDMKTAFEEILDDCRDEGRTEGETRKVIELVCRKLRKGQDCAAIADALEEDAAYIQTIIAAAQPFAPEYDMDAIYGALRME